MTFAEPFALLLLAAVPAGWWIHRARRSAPVVRVASLAAFSKASDVSPSSAPRRAADIVLVLVLAAMALLAVAAAGPQFGASRSAAFYVVTDRSISMTARTCDAEQRAAVLLSEADPAGERLAHDLGSPSSWDGLPASLASHLESARADGFPGIVLVTDSAMAPLDGVAVIGPSGGARANLAISSAVLDGEEALVTVRNFGSSGADAEVAAGAATRRVAVPAGLAATARFPAPERGASGEYRIVSPTDDLAADDALRVARRGGVRGIRLARDDTRLALALRAAGVEIGGDRNEIDVMVGLAPTRPRGRPTLVVAPTGKISTGAEHAAIRVVPGPAGGRVQGSEISSHGAFGDVLPAPGTTLAVAHYLTGGEPVWTDTQGVIVARERDLLVIAADPEDPSGDWSRDPSFPAFVAAALESLAGGPDRLDADAAVPAAESDVVHEPPRTSSIEEIRAAARPAGAATGTVRPAPILAVAAAVLLGAAAVLRRR